MSSAAPQEPTVPAGGADLAAFAAAHGLTAIGLRPPIPDYLKSVWERRHFIVELSRAREESMNAESRLGQFWQVLNPLLNVGVYFLIFGVLLAGSRATHYYISWLIIGVFIFTYTQASVLNGAKSISGNLGIVRALSFPRALMPLSSVIEELFTLWTSLLICVVAVLLQTHRWPNWHWLLVAPAVLLQSMFGLGLAFVFARLNERIRDVAQLLPFLLRTWLYLSGIVIDFTHYNRHKHAIALLMQINPGAVYPALVRSALLPGNAVKPVIWWSGSLWAIGLLSFGFIYFWRAEARYGRG